MDTLGDLRVYKGAFVTVSTLDFSIRALTLRDNALNHDHFAEKMGLQSSWGH